MKGKEMGALLCDTEEKAKNIFLKSAEEIENEGFNFA